MRAVEALSIRIKDIDFDSNPAKVKIRGEYTKTKVDRIIFLTEELTQQLKSWLDYKYRTRRVCHQHKQHGKTITEYRTPETISYLPFTKIKRRQVLIYYTMIFVNLLFIP